MSQRFEFFGFEPTAELETQARRAYDRVLGRAPYGAHLSAAILKEEDHYRCSLDLTLPTAPVTASIIDVRPEVALERAEHSVARKLKEWYRRRMDAIRNEELHERSAG